MRGLRKAFAACLSMALCLSMAVTSFATDPEITSSGASASSAVTLTVAAANFSVTVPTSLPVSVAADGTVTVAGTNPKIVNSGTGPVSVTGVAFAGRNDWTVTDYTADMSSEAVNGKKIALSINGKKAVSELSDIIASFSDIDGGDEQEFTYAANIPTQSTAIDATEVAAVTFTVGWSTV